MGGGGGITYNIHSLQLLNKDFDDCNETQMECIYTLDGLFISSGAYNWGVGGVGL